MRPGIQLPEAEIRKICASWGISTLALLGSILTENFTDESDIDFLVTFNGEVEPTLFNLVRLQDSLQQLLNR